MRTVAPEEGANTTMPLEEGEAGQTVWMSSVRYVCVSDLHLGSENSLLSNVPAGETTVDLSAPSPVLVQLVDCLASLVGRLSPDAPKPTLVLNGDVLELALADDEVAISVFVQFLELVFERHALFDPVVIYVPGNHDHRLWGSGRDPSHVGKGEPDATDHGDHAWATQLFDASRNGKGKGKTKAKAKGAANGARPAAGDMLDRAARRRPGLAHVTFELRYPTFAVESPEHRVVAFHHGHFTETSSSSISALRRTAFPREPSSGAVWDVEAENSPWVEFVWSTLGRPGAFGADVGVVHAMIQDPHAARAVAANLGAAAGGFLPGWMPPQVRRAAGRLMLRRVARRVAADERSSPTAPLSNTSGDGLRDFLNGPLWNQLRVAEAHADPSELVFVFGHTHKPFCDTLRYAGYGAPIARYNTGGWVVDSLRPLPGHGGAVLLLDEDLRAANVEVFRRHGSANTVSVHSASADHEVFGAAVRSAIDSDQAAWAELCATVDLHTPYRYRSLRAMIAEGVALTGHA